MADTTFVANTTIIAAAWLNAINDFYYTTMNGVTTAADGDFLVGDGTKFVKESGATARTSLGVGTGDNVTFTNLAATGTTTLTGVTTHGGNVVSDTDSTDDLGTTGVRWANLYVDDITMTTPLTLGNGGTGAALSAGTDEQVLTSTGSAIAVEWPSFVQRVEGTKITALKTITAVVPNDDTIPQLTTETTATGLTVTITPKATTHRLVIEAVLNGLDSDAARIIVTGLWKDTTEDAISVGWIRASTTGEPHSLHLHHEMQAGTTSAITFTVRMGTTAAGTVYLNGTGAAAKYGTAGGSYIWVEEYKA